MREKILTYLQTQYKFNSLEAKKIIYALEAILSESTKIIILLAISMPFHCVDKTIAITVVLLSIRCYSGGLHFSHYFSCLGFSLLFYAAAILLAGYPLPNTVMALGLLMSLGVFALVGPITSVMRPQLTPEEFIKYRHHTIFVLLFYSAVLISWKTLPYRNIIYWVIVLQIFQLLCAHLAQKGGLHEKALQPKDL